MFTLVVRTRTQERESDTNAFLNLQGFHEYKISGVNVHTVYEE